MFEKNPLTTENPGTTAAKNVNANKKEQAYDPLGPTTPEKDRRTKLDREAGS